MKVILQYKFLLISILLVIASVAALIFVLMLYKIEVVQPSKIQIDKNGTSNILIPNEDVYKFKVGEQISFKINNDFFKTNITKINFDDTKNIFYINVEGINRYLIPNTWIDVEIIKDSESIFTSLMSV